MNLSRYDGKVQLHVLESEGVVPEEKESKIFPETGKTDVIRSFIHAFT